MSTALSPQASTWSAVARRRPALLLLSALYVFAVVMSPHTAPHLLLDLVILGYLTLRMSLAVHHRTPEPASTS